jgi:hypothetical protein
MFTAQDVIESITEMNDPKYRKRQKSANAEPTVAAVSVEPAPSAKEDYSYLEDSDKWDEFGYPKRRPRVREPSEEEAAELLKMKYYIPEEYPAEKAIYPSLQMHRVLFFFDPNGTRDIPVKRAYLKTYFDLTEDQAERLCLNQIYFE